MNIERVITYGRSQRSLPYYFFSPAIFILPIVAVLYGGVSIASVALLILGGMLSWTFVEYTTHRFLFHKSAAPGAKRSLGPESHLRHHRNVDDPEYVVAPILISAILFFVYGILFVVATMSLYKGMVMASGLALGYLIYEHIHFSLHRNSFKSATMQRLKEHHMKHHFKDSQKYYGVTNIFWDKIFRSN